MQRWRIPVPGRILIIAYNLTLKLRASNKQKTKWNITAIHGQIFLKLKKKKLK
jgi:hypothetical protein